MKKLDKIVDIFIEYMYNGEVIKNNRKTMNEKVGIMKLSGRKGQWTASLFMKIYVEVPSGVLAVKSVVVASG